MGLRRGSEGGRRGSPPLVGPVDGFACGTGRGDVRRRHLGHGGRASDRVARCRTAVLVEQKTLFRDEWDSSVAHLKQIGMSSYRIVMGSEPPPSGQPHPDRAVLRSWLTEILPDMAIVLGGQLREDLPWNDPRNSAYFKAVIPTYLNPEVGVIRNPEGYGLSHYAGNIHVVTRDRASGRVGPGDASTTILVGEVAEGFKPWGDPTNLRDPGLGVNKVPGGFGGPSGSGAIFVFMDGSVRFLRDTTSREVLRRLSLPGPTDR